MNYSIIDYISNLPLKDYSEKEIIMIARANNISVFESYTILQKEIHLSGTKYFINLDSLETGVINKKEILHGNIKYFDKYLDFLSFIDKY